MSIVARVSIVVIGYFAACLIAALSFFALLTAIDLLKVGSFPFFFAFMGGSIGELLIAFWLLVCIGAFFPASILLAYTESTRDRRLLAYLIGGAAIAGLFAASAIILKPGDPAFITCAAGIVAGSFGGAAYWVLAGRRSNNWRMNFLAKR
jgi:hypothetical protein